MTVLSIRDLNKRYGGGPPVLRSVDLDVPEGVVGLLGPNGAGKSTLIQCVLGLLSGWDGEVRVLGLDARREQMAIRRRVGFMPETDAYLPDMSGLRAVRFLGRLSGMSRSEALRRAHEVLLHVGLGEAVYRQVREYSTGMRQRFKLAQALVHDPELVFLDEPLSGLDPQGREELLHLIRDLATKHDKHIIWSSHILPDVQKVAGAVAVLQDGQSRGVYRLEDLAPRDGVLQVEAAGDHAALAEVLTGVGCTLEPERRDGGETLGNALSAVWTVTLPPDVAPQAIFAHAQAVGARIRRLEPLSESLEEVFLRVLEAPRGPR